MIFVALLLLLGVSAVIYTTASSTSVSIANRQADNTARTLAQVKEALIGWSSSRDPATDGVNARPGELPCPDINPLDGYEDGSCVAGALGRVPWKTLKIPEPKDEAGETLWYTVAGLFRKHNNSTTPITSDTLGNITVYQNSTATTLTTQAAAVIFAPGAAVGTQDRSTTDTMACTAPSGTYARNLCASNYLETAGSTNNATINGPFIQAQSSSTFNDRLLVITNADLMPAVEQRVAREMISLLNQYRAATATSALYPGGVYPWADLDDGNSNGSGGAAYNHNRFPCNTALPTAWGAVPLSGTTATPTLPNWLKDVPTATPPDYKCTLLTGWASVIYYAVSRNILELTGITCTTCSANTLSVTNSSSGTGHVCSTSASPACATGIVTAGSADMLLITPGGFTGSPARNWPSSWSDITGYFEDSENYDNNNPNNDTYTVPASAIYNRDRIFIVR